MDDLAREQSECGAAIERLFINFKKDSPSRKTKTYLEKKLGTLEAEWVNIETRHTQLEQYRQSHADHAYFKQDFFNQVKEVYQTFKAAIEGSLQTLEESQQTFNSSGEDEGRQQDTVTQQRTIRKQKATITALQGVLTRVNTALRNKQSQAYYNQNLLTIREYWSKISTMHTLIMAEENLYDYKEDSFIELEAQVQGVIISIQEQQALNCSLPTSSTISSNMKLPKITLPSFNGNYLNWKEFHDLYVQLIHQQPMSASEKLFYLKAHLTGEASKLIQHLRVSEENYSAAWQILEGRYNNQRLLVSALLSRLLGQSTLFTESASGLKKLHDITNECLLGINNLGIPTKQWDPLLLHILLSKLDKETHRLYEQSLQSTKEIQTISDFLSFLEKRFQTLEALGRPKHDSEPKRTSNQRISLFTSNKNISCPICKGGAHPIFSCNKFLQMTPAERLQQIREARRCINCLKSGHIVGKCPSRRCLKCNAAHNTLLHIDKEGSTASKCAGESTSSKVSTLESAKNGATSLAARNTQIKSPNYVFLGTAIIYVYDAQNQPIKARALLDSGSQVNFITNNLYKKLGLSASSASLNISSIGKGQIKLHHKVNISVQSKLTNYAARMEAFILPQIATSQPNKYINVQDWAIPQNIKLADEVFNQPADIDLLIGAELFPEIMAIGQIKIGPNLPTLQNTLLGWIVLGKAENINQDQGFCGISMFEDISLEDQLQQFWTIEEVTVQRKPMSPADQECERYFKTTTKRTASGRYIVSLPFAHQPSLLGESKEIATRRFLSLERKLNKNIELKQQYIAFMKEYQQLGHMEEITTLPLKTPNYFLPHHCVLRPESSSTKLRVVFDGSAKSSTNVSLNDILHTGPQLQNDLFSILVRFRSHRYVFTCDISKMYRQILIDEIDRNFQLIVWRNSEDESLKYYKLNTVTYGTRSAPYLAIRCLRDLAKIEAARYPLGSIIIRNDIYVDDAITGSNDLKEAIEMRSQLTQLLKAGGFELRKWCANHSNLLHGIPKEHCVLENVIFDHQEGHIKTLGITWIPTSDQFMLNTSWKQVKKVTKRTILSDIAHIFDPLGIINPVIVLAKLFMQELWKLKLDWDAAVPAELHTRWLRFREELHKLNGLRIPRYMVITSAKDIQIHAFSDASEKAFGAVVYLRSENQIGVVNCHLVCAKSRVKPQKIISIPRLELCAAKLMVELVKKLHDCLPMGINRTVYWTDSQIVLTWLQTSSPLETFVANRVAFIQEATTINQWRFVNSDLNPADLVSRGTFPQQLLDSTMWFRGPIFLQQHESRWPINPPLRKREHWVRTNTNPTTLMSTQPEPHFLERINHKNSFKTLQRVTAYILKFINNLRSPQRSHSGSILSAEELQEAVILITKHMQATELADDISQLKTSGHAKVGGRLSTLTPFIDEKGLIRVGGRLQESNLTYDAKHPMVIPSNHIFTKLLFMHLHEENLHIGPRALLATVKQRFWPLRGKQLAKKVLHDCVRCFRAKPRSITQLMGNLPAERVQQARPFINVGIDFFGPVYIHYTLRGKRPTKAYIAVFICFASKATHFEVVTDLTTEAFIGALKRFIARRGRPVKIFTDNATNFIGARNELMELREVFICEENQQRISEHCAQQGIDWTTIPPRSPHFGGLWEAAVKSAKHHMKHVLKGASLTLEELTTAITQIEAILNSRPLTPISTDVNDLDALTPGHFLIGEPLTTLADPHARPRDLSLQARWNLVRSIHQEFWRRWSQEYLQELQNRYKWKNPGNNIPPGTLVLLKDDNLPPQRWRLGRVLRAIEGKDGQSRVLDIKTSTGETQRAIHRVCPLPIESEDKSLPAPNTTEVSKHKAKPTNHPLKGKFLPIAKWQTEVPEPTSTAKRKSSNDSSSAGKTIKINKLASVVTSVLLLMSFGNSLSQPVPENSIEVIQFTTNPGIYFEDLGQIQSISNEWNIIAYFNMTSYWEEFQGFRTCIEKLQKECTNITKRELCLGIISQLEQNLSEMEHLNFVLHHRNGPTKRTRRAPLNIVGTITNRLFGILDQEYAEQMENTINQVKTNEKHLLNLIKNQTSVIESTANVLRKTTEQVKQQFEVVENQLVQVYTKYNETQRMQIFNSLVAYTTLLMVRYQRTQVAVIDVVTDTHQGKLHPLLLTPDQLQRELTIIRKHLPTDLILPKKDEHDLLSIYELTHVKARVMDNQIVFDIRLPLLRSEYFQLFKIIPLPTRENNSLVFIEPSTPFLAVNLHRDRYYPVSQEEIQNCIIIEERKYMCKQRHPIFNSHSEQTHCEITLLNHKERLSPYCQVRETKIGKVWIQLHNPNHWIFSIDKEDGLNIVCGTTIINKRLIGEGLLKLQPNCVLKQPTMTISAHNTYSSHLALSFIPTINISRAMGNAPKNNPLLAPANVLIRADEDFTALSKSIEFLKAQQNLPEDVSHHDLHQYSIGYGTLIIVIGIIVVLLFKYIRRKPQINQTDSIDPAFELKELKGGEDVEK